MPKRIYGRRRPVRRRTMRRRKIMRRPISRLALKTHHFRRTCILDDIGSATSAYGGVIPINIGQLPDVNEFGRLYDCYRINKVVIKFVPNHNQSEVNPPSSTYIPNFFTVLDYTELITPTSLNELFEYQNMRMTRGTTIHTRKFTPASHDQTTSITGGSSTQASNPTFKQWIAFNSDNPTVLTELVHFGLKYWVDNTLNDKDVIWKVYCTYYFSCKSVK